MSAAPSVMGFASLNPSYDPSPPVAGRAAYRIEVGHLAAQTEFRHLDRIVGMIEDHGLPVLPPGVNFHHERARLDHEGVVD
jgi:hypothetical protein